jgi:hypothetical protein
MHGFKGGPLLLGRSEGVGQACGLIATADPSRWPTDCMERGTQNDERKDP